MNDQQLTELRELQNLTFEAVKIDCDPRNWNGYNKIPQEMTKEERGGRNFDLKNADKSLAIFARITNIIDTHTKPTQGNIKSDEDNEKAIQEAKKSAKERLEKLGLKVVNNKHG